MRVVHLNTAQPVSAPARLTKQQVRVKEWIARQNQRNYDEAVAENAEAIKKIQKSIPGWMPEK